MKKLLFTFVLSLVGVFSFAQIEGKWKTIDDETKQAKSIVEITKDSKGVYKAKVVQLLIKPEDPNCSKCKDDRKNKPILGMDVIRGVVKKGDEFSGGKITNPKDGKSYNVELEREGNTLLVKAIVLGIAVKTQVWHKVN